MNYSIGSDITIIYGVTIAVSVILTIILNNNLTFYYNTKYHGVHETNFTFTGDYLISTDLDDNDIYYTSKCHSISPFGDCYYKCYESDLYQNAVDYAVNYCIPNTTIVGYISTDTTNNRCWTSNPNSKIHNTLLTFRITLGYLLINVIIWFFIHYSNNINLTLRKNSIKCEPLDNSSTSEDAYDEL